MGFELISSKPDSLYYAAHPIGGLESWIVDRDLFGEMESRHRSNLIPPVLDYEGSTFSISPDFGISRNMLEQPEALDKESQYII